MGLKSANETFAEVVGKTEELDKFSGIIPDLTNELVSETRKARTFLNKAEKAKWGRRASYLETAGKAVQKGARSMKSIAEEAEKMANLTKRMGELYEESQNQLLE